MVPPRRFERLAYGLGIRCSIQLSYGGLFIFNKLLKNSYQKSMSETWPKLIFACLGLLNLMSNTTDYFLFQQVFAL